jgi:hydroxyacyl-ACP dehydratase HTD2-like protein with hotdog domain
MFAGVKANFHSPLMLGEATTREGLVTNVEEKEGTSGRLTFVTVNYQYYQKSRLCIEEEQAIVYRDPGGKIVLSMMTTLPPLASGAWGKTLTPDPTLLFRFSALTFNAHRIHYDQTYASQQEGWPDVTNGPLYLRANPLYSWASHPQAGQTLPPYPIERPGLNGEFLPG